MVKPWTPGPWHIREGGNYVKVGAAGYDEYVEREHYLGGPLCVADIEDKATEDLSENHALAMDNGRLISAAPELFDAVVALLEWAALKYRYEVDLAVLLSRPLLGDTIYSKETAGHVQPFVLAHQALVKALSAIQSPTPQQEAKKGTQGGQNDER